VLVTREADYAVRCVVEVARAGHTSAAQVARLQGISPTFLGKIVQSLAKAGILATRRGVGGGITLARPPEEFTLLEVIEAVVGPLCIVECLRQPKGCEHQADCPAYPYLAAAQRRLRDGLSVSFAEVLAGLPPVLGEPLVPAAGQATGDGNGSPRAARTPDPAATGGGA
jgi:Rrf2 family protein